MASGLPAAQGLPEMPGGLMAGLERFPGEPGIELSGRGTRMTIKSEPFVVNIGPQHPSTHGVFRLRLTLDGEKIIDADMVMGYLHRSMEKLAEERTYTQNIPFTDRTDYLAAMTGNLAYVHGGREADEHRGAGARALAAHDHGELQRIASHAMADRHLRQRLRRLADARHAHVPRPREDPRPVRDGLRRAADAELHAHRRRLEGHPGRVDAAGARSCCRTCRSASPSTKTCC